jgi:phage gp29-like protein
MNTLALRSSLSTLRAGFSLLRAGLGLGTVAPRATVRSPISDFTPIMWGGRRLSPDQVRWILESAVGGNLQAQWDLFDLMEDTWPRLVKNLNEIRNPAARCTYNVQAYAARNAPASESAKAKAALVEAALESWLPRPGTLELGLEEALYDSLDAYGKGMSVLEVSWQQSIDGILPRCAHLLSPRRYGWNTEGTELGLLCTPSSVLNRAASDTWEPFPPGQFWVGAWRSRSGVPGQTALLRCLAPYWVGITFGWEWLLSTAQIFGVPFRWATYDTSHPELATQLAAMLENLGSAGWAAFPAGTQLEFKDAVQRATDNPQILIQSLADKACDLVILGQELSGGAQPAGLGGGAAGLQGDVRRERIQYAAQWCADLLNYQLVPAVVRFNFGDTSELPVIQPDLAGAPDPKALADRDQVLLASGAKLPQRWFYERHGVPLPEQGEPVITPPAPAAAPGAQFPGPVSDRVLSAAPGGTGSPESAAAPIAARASTPPAADLTPLLRAAAADLAPARARIEAIIRLAEAGKDEVALSALAALQADFPQLAESKQLTTALDRAMGEAALVGAQDALAKNK